MVPLEIAVSPNTSELTGTLAVAFMMFCFGLPGITLILLAKGGAFKSDKEAVRIVFSVFLWICFGIYVLRALIVGSTDGYVSLTFGVLTLITVLVLNKALKTKKATREEVDE